MPYYPTVYGSHTHHIHTYVYHFTLRAGLCCITPTIFTIIPTLVYLYGCYYLWLVIYSPRTHGSSSQLPSYPTIPTVYLVHYYCMPPDFPRLVTLVTFIRLRYTHSHTDIHGSPTLLVLPLDLVIWLDGLFYTTYIADHCWFPVPRFFPILPRSHFTHHTFTVPLQFTVDVRSFSVDVVGPHCSSPHTHTHGYTPSYLHGYFIYYYFTTHPTFYLQFILHTIHFCSSAYVPLLHTTLLPPPHTHTFGLYHTRLLDHSCLPLQFHTPRWTIGWLVDFTDPIALRCYVVYLWLVQFTSPYPVQFTYFLFTILHTHTHTTFCITPYGCCGSVSSLPPRHCGSPRVDRFTTTLPGLPRTGWFLPLTLCLWFPTFPDSPTLLLDGEIGGTPTTHTHTIDPRTTTRTFPPFPPV